MLFPTVADSRKDIAALHSVTERLKAYNNLIKSLTVIFCIVLIVFVLY